MEMQSIKMPEEKAMGNYELGRWVIVDVFL
jgi:hypothetical protein